MQDLRIADLIDILQCKLKEFGNLRVVGVTEYNDIHRMYEYQVQEGYDNCDEFMDYVDNGDPENDFEMVLAIKVD